MVGTMAAGTAMNIYAKKKAGDYEAQVAENNAALAEQQRKLALDQGVQDASLIRSQGRQVAGQAQAAIGASGIDGTTGSMGNIFAVNEANAAIDAERLKANAARTAWGFANEARDEKARAKMMRKATLLGGIGEGLGSAVNLAGSTYGKGE
jgi:hypothetical protein